jgi:hypothetical protein
MCSEKECYLVETGFGFEINGERNFSRGHYIPYKTVFNFIEQRNRYSVFTSAYRYSNTDITKSELYGDLYLDFDSLNEYDKVKADALTALSYLKIVYHIEESQVKIYYSGNKGIHIIVPAELLGVEPMVLLNGVFKTIALSIKSFTPNKTIDTQIYDNKRLFRIPNTIHEKSKLYKVPITSDELRNLSEDEIKTLAQQPRQIQHNTHYEINHIARKQFERAIEEYQTLSKESKKDKRFKSKYNFTPPCIQYVLENGAIEGQRNITIACLTGFCKNSGKSLNETIDFISDWNSKNIKPTGDQEMKKTIKSIFMGEKLYGCSTLKLISVCDESRCKLAKKKEGTNNVVSSENKKA